MISKLFLTSLLVAQKNASALRPSSGCSASEDWDCWESPFQDLGPGESEVFRRKVEGTQYRTHKLTLPTNYDSETPSPLIMYFHGWGGSYESCGDNCSVEAASEGFAVVAMTGYGQPDYNSWKVGGSNGEGGPFGPTCEDDAIDYCSNYGERQGCDCDATNDNCSWTTCFDSVEQVLKLLDEVEESLCIDLDNIWAMGCSNGGMFTYEIAKDERSAPRFKGIVPIVGLPHYGFSTGPTVEGTTIFAMMGNNDTDVPPVNLNDTDSDLTIDTLSWPGGWYYTSLNKVVEDWTEGNACDVDLISDIYETDDTHGVGDNFLECSIGCTERDDGVRVIGCIFEGGHVCHNDVIWKPALDFMKSMANIDEKMSDQDEVALF